MFLQTKLTAIFLATLSGLVLLLMIMQVVELLRRRERSMLFRKWSKSMADNANQSGRNLNYPFLKLFLKGMTESMESIWPFNLVFNLWKETGFGIDPLLMIVLFFGIVCSVSLGGYILTKSTILSGSLIGVVIFGFLGLMLYRIRNQRILFEAQIPDVLDRLSDSLEAGFSLPQAMDFIAENLPQPSATELSLVSTQIRLGFSLEESLSALYHRRPTEDIRLLAEGLSLQRLIGGNMAEMMREMANMVRSRAELRSEIQTLTAQGRVSAIVIALLVPISLGLLSFFPGYTDVLYHSRIGNLVLAAAGCLELIGAILIRKLIRIEF